MYIQVASFPLLCYVVNFEFIPGGSKYEIYNMTLYITNTIFLFQQLKGLRNLYNQFQNNELSFFWLNKWALLILQSTEICMPNTFILAFRTLISFPGKNSSKWIFTQKNSLVKFVEKWTWACQKRYLKAISIYLIVKFQ